MCDLYHLCITFVIANLGGNTLYHITFFCTENVNLGIKIGIFFP